MIYEDLFAPPGDNVVIHDHAAKQSYWTQLRLSQPSLGDTRAAVTVITETLTSSVARYIGNARSNAVPVVIMRGAAFFLPSLWNHFSNSKIGFILPRRDKRTGKVAVVHADVPAVADTFLIFDLIINAGDTVEAVIAWLASQPRANPKITIQIIAPFTTVSAAEHLRGRFRNVKIHTFWNSIPRRQNGWLACLDFDAGELAFTDTIRNPVIGRGLGNAGASHSLRKVAALIRRGSRILTVTKKGKNRNEVIMPGGKPLEGESQEQTLRRELREELGVEIDSLRWFGLFEGKSTFEGVPMNMDVYSVRIRGAPAAAREIAELNWINMDDETVVVGNLLRDGVLPALRRRSD